MRFVISLAIKNLFRYRRRTIITALAIAARVAMFIFMDGWLKGAEKDSIRNLVKFETGSARVMDNTYWEEHDYLLPKYYIKDPDPIMEKLQAAGYTVAPRVTILATVSKVGGEKDSYTLQLAGIDPARDPKIFDLANAITPKEGSYLKAGELAILLGEDVAARLGVGFNDAVSISTRTKDGVWTGMEARVTGILSTPDPIVNNSMGFIPLDVMQDMLQMGTGVTDIVIGFPEWIDPDQETAKINTLLGKQTYSAKSFNDLAAEFGMIAQTKSGGSKVIIFLIFIIAAIGISNTILMAVYERVREIGMMRALGMKDRSILLGFVFEALGIGLLGAVLGVFLGVIINLYMVNVGIDLGPFIKDMGNIGYRIAGVSKSTWNVDSILTVGVLSVLFSGVFAVLPAMRALKKQITDCLRVK